MHRQLTRHACAFPLQVYESTLVSLQALGQAFGKQSAEVQQARAALLAVLQHAAGQVDSAYGQQAVYQVALLGDAPVRSSDPSQLVMWKQVTRRSLLGESPSLTCQSCSTAGVTHRCCLALVISVHGMWTAHHAVCLHWDRSTRCMPHASLRGVLSMLLTAAACLRPTEAPETALRANGTSADARVFSSKAAGYGAALILVYFSIAAVFCMCNMNIKQDTLLYTRAKVD
jgi:hypothetical protein